MRTMPVTVTPFASLLRGVVITFLLAGTLALSSYGVYTWYQEKSDVEENLLILSGYLASASQSFYENLGNSLIPLGQLLDNKDVIHDPELARPLLDRFQARYPEIGAMALFSPEGQMLVNTATAPGTKLPDFRDDPTYLKQLQAVLADTSVYVVGPPEYGKVIKQWRFPFRHVVRAQNGRARFILQAAIPLENNGAFLEHLPVPPDSFIGILRDDGLQQARWPIGEPAKVYGRISEGPVAQMVRRDPNIQASSFSGVSPWSPTEGNRIGAFTRLSKAPFYAYISAPAGYLWDRWWRRNAPILISFLLFLLIFYFITYRVTARERTHSRELLKQARHDSLTGLPNRLAAEEILEAEIKLAKLTQQGFAVLFLDLDRFKDINDTLGHLIGDHLLITVAGAIKTVLRHSDVLSRFAGDEFLIILPGSDYNSAVFTCERLINLFAVPFQVDAHVLPVTASIGIALYPNHGTDIVSLTQHADTAMYEAKRQGRNAYVMYEQDIGDKIRQRISLEQRLRESLLKEEFRLVYQPIMDVSSGRLIGIEALLRWVDSEGRLRFPAEFINVAEESGLILPLGEWVLHSACAQTKIWNDAGNDLWVAVNLSTRQFQDPHLVSKVIEVLRDSGLEPTRLELEITESAAMLNPQASIEILGRLKAMGVHIAIDDFGTGYSSLSYLKRIPADKIKIDKSFVDGVTNDPDDIAIVRTIIALANSLEMHTVAEGIETAEQLRAIEKYGCKQAQGYWISHPLPPENLAELFDRFDISSRHLASK